MLPLLSPLHKTSMPCRFGNMQTNKNKKTNQIKIVASSLAKNLDSVNTQEGIETACSKLTELEQRYGVKSSRSQFQNQSISK